MGDNPDCYRVIQDILNLVEFSNCQSWRVPKDRIQVSDESPDGFGGPTGSIVHAPCSFEATWVLFWATVVLLRLLR